MESWSRATASGIFYPPAVTWAAMVRLHVLNHRLVDTSRVRDFNRKPVERV